MGPAPRLLVSRYLPLLVAAVACWWLYRRRLRWDAELAAAAMTATLIVRAAADPALAQYYLMPGAAFFTIMWRRSWTWPLIGFVAGLLLRWRFASRPALPGLVVISGDQGMALTAARMLAVATTAGMVAFIVIAWHRVIIRGREQSGGGGPESDRPTPGLAQAPTTS
jgi:hypothetical protein